MAFGRDTTDRRFEHFCRTGDPDALGDVFDATAGRLMRVALWLAGNRADAEDLLQRTFLQAIETRASFAPGERVVPWLMGLLGNQARKLRRERQRTIADRALRERVVDPEVEVAASELAEAVRAVRERLGEPYREVLALHLEQGLSAKEIAQRLQRPAGTVRTQLVRALDLLRRKLPGGFVAGIAVLAVVEPSALAAVRANVLAAANSAVLPAGAGTAVVLGGALVTKSTLAVVPLLALLCAFGVWFTLRGDARDGATSSVEPLVAAAARERAATAPASAPGAALPREAIGGSSGDDPGFATLRVVVTWERDGAPAAGVGLRVCSRGIPFFGDRSALTGHDGSALVRHLPPGRYGLSSLWILHDDLVLAAGETRTLRLTANSSLHAEGRVLDEQGQPVADAGIWLSDIGTWKSGWDVTRSRTDGTFSVPLNGMRYVGARQDGHLPSNLVRIDAERGARNDIVLTLRGKAARLRGIVRDHRGKVVAGASVFVGPPGGAVLPNGSDGLALTEPGPVVLTTAEDGTFACTEVPPHRSSVRVWAKGFGPREAWFEADAGSTTEVAVTLEPAAVVHGIVRDEDGKPLANVAVRHELEFDGFPIHWVRSDAEGRFRLEELPARSDAHLVARDRERVASAKLTLRAGETTEWNPVLGAGITVRGTVFGPDQRPLPGLKVSALHADHSRLRRWVETDAQGRFALTDFGDSPRDVEVTRGEMTLVVLPRVAPDTEDLVVRLGVRDLPTARLRGRVVDERALGMSGHVSLMRTETQLWSGTRLDANGAFAFGPAPAGRYEAVVFLGTGGRVPIGFVTLEPNQERVLDDIVVLGTGGAVVTVLDRHGARVNNASANLLTTSGQHVAQAQVQSGTATFTDLQPGRFVVEVWYRDTHEPEALSAEVLVQSGTVTPSEVRGRLAVPITVHLHEAGAPDAVCAVTVVWRRIDGGIVHIVQNHERGPHPMVIPRFVAPGRYVLECATEDGRHCTKSIELLAHEAGAEAPNQEFRVDLPAK